MAVEYLILNVTGPKGRKPGVVVNMVGCKDGEKVKWGSGERPPAFFVVHVDGISHEDPNALMWFKPHYCEYEEQSDVDKAVGIEHVEKFRCRSRFLFNIGKLSAEDKAAISDGDGRITIDRDALKTAWVDQKYCARAAIAKKEVWEG